MARRSASLLHLGNKGYVNIADDVIIIIIPTNQAGTTLIKYQFPTDPEKTSYIGFHFTGIRSKATEIMTKHRNKI